MAMHARRWLGLILAVGLTAGTGYMAYAAVTGGEYLVKAAEVAGCATPGDQYGWAYEAINYDIADDATLEERNADLAACTDQGAKSGQEVVTDDGVRIGGWYIPAANGAGPTAPTVVLVPGFRANKSGILHYGVGLHDEYNLVAFDLRNSGRSTGDRTSAGVLEQRDLRAIIDWLERTKHPEHIGVLGNSLGAATALAEAVGDDRVEALVLDSMHTRLRYQVEARVEQEFHHPAYPATWAVLAGASFMARVDVSAADPDDVVTRYDDRPMLLIHGTADTQDLPVRTQAFFDGAVARGIPVDLRWCDDSGHNSPKGMPAEVCADDYGRWLRDFFSRAIG
jgi:pimeloyl-ACP methyl ester carboxylesterase